MKARNVNLLEGRIDSALGRLSLPIMASSFIQMFYSITDMFWVGRMGAYAVAAVGAAGMYLWLSEGFMHLARMGGQVLTAQALGQGKPEAARRYAQAAIQLGMILGLLYTLSMIVFRRPLLAFFAFHEMETLAAGENYLAIVAVGISFSYLARILTALLAAGGNTHSAFVVTSLGLLLNILIDPLLIFVFGMGVAGAAYATVFSQVFVFVLFLLAVREKPLFKALPIFRSFHLYELRKIIKLGIPAAMQTLLYAGFSMYISRMVAAFGDLALAAQRIGGQVEAISWLSAEGLAVAINAFMAQNYGARQARRLRKGYWVAWIYALFFGLLSSFLLAVFPREIMSLFFRETEVLQIGIHYLRILALSQAFMAVELMTVGAFAGYGNTFFPSVVIILLTGARIPLAFFLQKTALGLNGIWWAISISTIAKGSLLFIFFLVFQRRRLRHLSFEM